MSLEGNAEAGYVLRGKIHGIPNAVIDKTLTKEGQCADAKATGDAIANNAELTAVAYNRAWQADGKADTALQRSWEALGHTPPSLTNEQKTQLTTLVSSYRTNRKLFTYDTDVGRNIYASTECLKDGKVLINCGLFAQLVWAGVSPDTFTNAATSYDGSIAKAFDWGYYCKFPQRKAYNVTKSDGNVYHLTKPYADSYEDSYSYNSYYGASITRDDKQHFYSFMYAADVANELYVKGCEIPMAEADVGDMIFFNTVRTNDGNSDNFERFAFRSITHAAIITDIDRDNHKISITECTNAIGADYVITANSITSADKVNYLRNISLLNHVAMVARHPAAFGEVANVPDKFTVI